MFKNNKIVISQTEKAFVVKKAQDKNHILNIKNKDLILLELKKVKKQVNSCIALLSQNKINSTIFGSTKSVVNQIVSSGSKLKSVNVKIEKSINNKPSSSDDKA